MQKHCNNCNGIGLVNTTEEEVLRLSLGKTLQILCKKHHSNIFNEICAKLGKQSDQMEHILKGTANCLPPVGDLFKWSLIYKITIDELFSIGRKALIEENLLILEKEE